MRGWQITKTPTEQDAKRILVDALGKGVKSIYRFPTGLAHYVYDVETEDAEKLVIRLTRPDMKDFFVGALHWYALLKRKNVPLPNLYFSSIDDPRFEFPVMIMERLSGNDLDVVYSRLSTEQKHDLADKLIAIQQSVATLPMGQGYGYASSVDDPTLHPQWIMVLEENIERSRQRFEVSGLVNDHAINRLIQGIYAHRAYFKSVLPTCFLDDITTKNVIVDNSGHLAGIVDVDVVAFGDPLLTLSLTRMALLSRNYDTNYTDYWAEQLQLTAQQQHAMNLYTAMFCLDFMSELGHAFNKEIPTPVDQVEVERFTGIFASLLV